VETLQDLSDRIESAGELESVVSSMKTLATLNIRGYERATGALEEYTRTVEMGLQILFRRAPQELPLAEPRDDGRLGLLVIGSDQGMCGPFNERMARFVEDHLRQLDLPPDRRDLHVAGARLESRLEQLGEPPLSRLELPASVEGITPVVQELLPRLDAWRRDRGIRRIELCYHHRSKDHPHEPTAVQLLPVDREWLGSIAHRSWEGPSLPRFRSSWETLFSDLVGQYLFVWLFRAFAESLASENAARLQSMTGAEDNIRRRIRKLRDRYHRTRQSLVTEELLDLTSGYAALSGRDDRRRHGEATGERPDR